MEFCRYYSLVKPIFAQRDLRSVSSINEHTRVCTCTAKTKKIFFYFLATLCSTWKCLASTWGWNVASKRCCSFTGKDIADRVKDNISTVARRPRARSIQPKFPEISVQYLKDRFGPTGKVSKKTGPPFEVVLFSRSDRSEFWLNGSRPRLPADIR